MTDLNLQELPHCRLNILTGDWVLVSPHRNKRPWQGQQEKIMSNDMNPYDKDCYLCPGNNRAGGQVNPAYSDTFVFDNDFSALLPDTDLHDVNEADLLISHGESGICRVICFSPNHDLTLAKMDTNGVRKVVDTWIDEYLKLGSLEQINYVQIFENKGSIMGCSNPHPHGQIWSQHTVPCEPAREMEKMVEYYDKTGRPLLQDYLSIELDKKDRIVCYNKSFVAFVPYWATWPLETLILPFRNIQSIEQMRESEKTDFADIMRRITTKYDNLFGISFPYSSGIHQAPTDGLEHPEWTFHMHYYPPLLRSATVRKFMVGYEMLGGAQRDTTPEDSASLLRQSSEIHYTLKQQKTSI